MTVVRTADLDRVTAVSGPPAQAGMLLRSVDAPGYPRARGNHRIRVLVFTSLYPNVEQPRRGIFVEERLRKLIESGRVAATVVAPVPWFPSRARSFGGYAAFARVPRREEHHGIEVLHPRYPVIPKVGMNVAPALMYRALLPTVRALLRESPGFDLIDAHYFYPDGVAAVRIGATVGKPVVISARGTDLNVIPRYRRARQQIQWAAGQAAAIVTVSQALKRRAEELGMEPGKVTVLRNGVDLDEFHVRDHAVSRAELGLDGTVWLTVGHLIATKGVDIAISALAQVPAATLLVVGEGPECSALEHLARRLGVDGRVRFVGTIPHESLSRYYNAADALLLASASEGMPNVVLEAVACGTPVIATAVGGIPEILSTSAAGELMSARSPDALVAAWQELQQRAPDRRATRRFAEAFGWQPVVEAQGALYESVLGVQG